VELLGHEPRKRRGANDVLVGWAEGLRSRAIDNHAGSQTCPTSGANGGINRNFGTTRTINMRGLGFQCCQHWASGLNITYYFAVTDTRHPRVLSEACKLGAEKGVGGAENVTTGQATHDRHLWYAGRISVGYAKIVLLAVCYYDALHGRLEPVPRRVGVHRARGMDLQLSSAGKSKLRP
jgi:hypothetical protein